VVGQFARQCAGLLREIRDRSHVIGNHTATHANLFWRMPGQIQAEIQDCNDAVFEVSGLKPKWFRPPWGMRNPWVISSATAAELRTVLWSHLPGDWQARPASWLVRRMEPIATRARAADLSAKNSRLPTGDILCLHDGDYRFLNADRRATVEALQYWLPRWRDLGLEFVTIDEAVSSPAR
jgi:peptidoglycan-N-acetylglucosamine deacetylase